MDALSFRALRILGEVVRRRGDLVLAQAVYRQAQSLAVELNSRALESAAVEGLALVARQNDDTPQAINLLERAAQLARLGGDEQGRASVLSNLGEILHTLGRQAEAESAFREALACPGLPTDLRAVFEDNLARTLALRGQVAEAVLLTTRAADHFAKEGMWSDRYIALRNLAGFNRMLGQSKEAGRAFSEAHELMHRMAAAAVEPQHYKHLAERVREIQKEIVDQLSAKVGQQLEDPEQQFIAVTMDIGIHRYLGEQLTSEGMRLYESADYDGAEQAMLKAIEHWEYLGARHELPRVHQALGMVYTEVGQPELALKYLLLGRREAAELGDASSELMACGNLCRLVLKTSDPFSEIDPVELIARARALEPIAIRQAHAQLAEQPTRAGISPQFDVVDTLDATICFLNDSPDLAEVAIRRAIKVAEVRTNNASSASMRYRLIMRLTTLHSIMMAQQKGAEATAVERRLDSLAAEDPNPRTQYIVNQHLGYRMFLQHNWNPTALNRLKTACDTYEGIRGQALAIGDLGQHMEFWNPPFEEAAEVALHLGLTEEAFHFLERTKARSLLEALQSQAGDQRTRRDLAEELQFWREFQEMSVKFYRPSVNETPDAEAVRREKATARLERLQPKLEDNLSILDHLSEAIVQSIARPTTSAEVMTALAARDDDSMLIEFFVGSDSVSAFVLDRDGVLQNHRLADPREERWKDLRRLVTSMNVTPGVTSLEALTHPAIAEVSAFIQEVARERTVFIVPHRFLHMLPLHLIYDRNGRMAARPRTFYLPSSSLFHYVAANAPNAVSVLVGGDPQDNLPYAALEAVDVAARFGSQPTLGSACTPDWLAHNLVIGHPPLRLVHLACHAIIHSRRPERSGIVLSSTSGPHVVDVRELAALDWNSQLTVISACSSGQQQVRTGDELSGVARTLLARGARSLIMALWPVPDLATYLIIKELHDRLSAAESPTLDNCGTALAGAQDAVRNLTARQLVAVSGDLREIALAKGDERIMICAMAALARAHRSAGNREEWLCWREAIRCRIAQQAPPRDLGSPDWGAQAVLAEHSAYDATPFSEPTNWAAFVLIGCGQQPQAFLPAQSAQWGASRGEDIG
jgi:CHAT domain-containing protein/tetratricopeptide (TPR) repeat protein